MKPFQSRRGGAFPSAAPIVPAATGVGDLQGVLDEPAATFGDQAADAVAASVGSWPFVIGQSIILALWLIWNTAGRLAMIFDPYPFQALNLMLSFQAAYTGPIVMIAANRQAKRDRQLLERVDRLVQHHETQTVHIERLSEDIDSRMGALETMVGEMLALQKGSPA